MEFIEQHGSRNAITAFTGDAVEIDGRIHPLPLVVGARLFRQPENSPSDLTADSFQAALEGGAEAVIVGTGTVQRFLHPRLAAGLAAHGVGLETMSTAAACRTYMLLQSEGRNVWAWLW